jgi:hypothetical protein
MNFIYFSDEERIKMMVETINKLRLEGNYDLCMEKSFQVLRNLSTDTGTDTGTNGVKEAIFDVKYNMSIAAYYTKYKSEGLKYCEDVIFSLLQNDKSKINNTINNSTFYMNSLKYSRDKIQILPRCHDQMIKEMYINSSPSLISLTGLPVKYRYNVRYVNYRLTKGVYSTHGDKNYVHTRNILLDLDENFNILHERELILDSELEKKVIINKERNVKGLEDVRLIGENSFFCTCLETNTIGTPQICLGTYNIKTGVISNLIPMSVTKEIQCEKNWLPFYYKNDLCFIYGWKPLTIYTTSVAATVATVKKYIYNSSFPKDLSSFRGSAPPIPYKNGYIATVHYIYSDPYNYTIRKYFHRFVWFCIDLIFEESNPDELGAPEITKIAYSEPFYFNSKGVEFNLSITLVGNEFAITHSDNDSTSFINFISTETVDKMLFTDISDSGNIAINE